MKDTEFLAALGTVLVLQAAYIYSSILYSYRATYISSLACAYTSIYCADSSHSNMP